MSRLLLVISLCGAAAFQPDVASSHNIKAMLQAQVLDVSEVKAAAEVFPVPTASRCIVIMVIQYMVIYTALAMSRTYLECYYSAPLVRYKTRGLTSAAQTMSYSPMLCVLFIASRQRVEFLTDGKGQPQMWVQNLMYAVTGAVLASTLVVLITPFITGKELAMREGSCDLETIEVTPRFNTHIESKVKFYALTSIRYLILVCLYGGIAGIIVGINMYMPPGQTDPTKVIAPSTAVQCTMTLSVVFFLTQLVIAACQTYTEFKGVDYYAGHIHKIIQVMNAAASTVEFAPMLAILFLAARMRAMQHDSEPQSWAQHSMHAATGALCLTTLLSILVPYALGGSMKTNPTTREATFEVPNQTVGYFLIAIRFTCMVAFYLGVVVVIISIFNFEAPAGQTTMPVSPAVSCVVSLTVMFFAVYFVLICCLTISEVSGGNIPLETYRFYSGIEAAKSTLPWAPMLAILFVTTRMYALLITDKNGAPQAWVQDGMYMATWSLLISLFACVGMGFVDEKVETDEDGFITNKFSNNMVAVAMTVLRYFTMAMLYGGIVTVIVGLFVMTPETANGRGSILQA